MGDRLGIQVAVDILEFSYISTQKHYHGVIMLMSYQDRRLSCFINIQNLLIKIYHLVWQNSPFTSLWQQKLPCPRWGSNSRPSDYETDALPTALRRHCDSMYKIFSCEKNVCTHGGTRTPNLRFRRPTPYPLGHAGTCELPPQFPIPTSNLAF